MATQVKVVWMVACLATFDHGFPQEVVRGGVRDEYMYKDDVARRDVAEPILFSGRTGCGTHPRGGPSMEKEAVLKLFAGRKRLNETNRMPRPARYFRGAFQYAPLQLLTRKPFRRA